METKGKFELTPLGHLLLVIIMLALGFGIGFSVQQREVDKWKEQFALSQTHFSSCSFEISIIQGGWDHCERLREIEESE